MNTPIYVSKKLEKSIKRIIVPETKMDIGILGKWNATIFHVDRKKCWLISNARTQYSVILTEITTSDFDKIDDTFKKAFFKQLVYDGIIVQFEILDKLIGSLKFLPTDNDCKTIGFLNHRLISLDWWKKEFGNLKNMPINDLTNRINISPIHIGKGQKLSDYTDSIVEMKNLLIE